MRTTGVTIKTTFLRKGAALLVGVALLLSPVRSQAWSGDFLEAVKNFAQEIHLQEFTDEALLEGAIKGMLSGMDPHSAFLNREETAAYQSGLSGKFSGIGAVLVPDEGGAGVRVSSVFPGSPAEKADVREGDVILQVNGQSIAGKTPTDAALMIRGDAGTTVTLLLRRGATTLTRQVVRGQIQITAVSHRVEGDVGIVHISQFSRGMSADLSDTLAQLRKTGIRKLILDLRDNPGGYVDEAVAAARLLIPPGPIVHVDYRSERLDDEHYTTESPDPGWILAVLVNGETASASEILAGAIQDAENGVLIGQKTYGKGVVQHLFTLLTPQAREAYGKLHPDTFVTEVEWSSYYDVRIKPEEIFGLMKITTGRYLTRNGRALDKEGLPPDITVADRVRDKDVDPARLDSLVYESTLSTGAYASSVRLAEIVLHWSGLFAAAPDKAFTEETGAALRAWQKKAGLPGTGVLDQATTASLNGKLEMLRREKDLPYAKAMSTLRLFSTTSVK